MDWEVGDKQGEDAAIQKAAPALRGGCCYAAIQKAGPALKGGCCYTEGWYSFQERMLLYRRLVQLSRENGAMQKAGLAFKDKSKFKGIL